MLWFWLTIIAGVGSAGHHLVDRYVLREGKDPIAFAFLFQFLGVTFLLPILPLDLKVQFEVIPTLLLLLAGTIEVLTITLFGFMHRFVEASISSIIMRLRMVWVALLAFCFLGERLSSNGILGIILILFGLGAVSYKKLNEGVKYSSKGLIFPFLFSFTTAIESILMKNATKNFSAAWIYIILLLPSVITLPVVSKGLLKRVKKLFESRGSWILFTAFLATLSLYSFQWALRFGDVARIVPIYQSVSILTVLGGIIFLGERERIWQKILGGVLAAVGVVLVMGS